MKIPSVTVVILSLAVLPACNTTSPERCERKPGKPYMTRECSPGHEGKVWLKKKRNPPITHDGDRSTGNAGKSRAGPRGGAVGGKV